MEKRGVLRCVSKMKPEVTGEKYNRIAEWWRQQHEASGYGVEQLRRAVTWVTNRKRALDVGCGSSGRFINELQEHGFQVDGIDISEEMIRHARELHPESEFAVADISQWKTETEYDLVCAWDSTFHLPLDLHEAALKNMCNALAPGGVVMFTCGGSHEPSKISGTFQGEDFEYSTLGIPEYFRLLHQFGCVVRHVEFDQGPTEPHVYMIAQRTE